MIGGIVMVKNIFLIITYGFFVLFSFISIFYAIIKSWSWALIFAIPLSFIFYIPIVIPYLHPHNLGEMFNDQYNSTIRQKIFSWTLTGITFSALLVTTSLLISAGLSLCVLTLCDTFFQHMNFNFREQNEE